MGTLAFVNLGLSPTCNCTVSLWWVSEAAGVPFSSLTILPVCAEWCCGELSNVQWDLHQHNSSNLPLYVCNVSFLL